MSTAPAIRFQHVSKRYYLGTRRAHASHLLPGFVQRRLNGRRPAGIEPAPSSNELWALKDVSFEVQPGEVLGIIGPNGAGKTTALSLLAGITSPTSGRIEVRGRVGALIQLGAGFHPDLTGRENVFLYASVLGLRKARIDRLYDDIVQFAELGPFMDTPVKRYSTGMYVRLGFSVAVHIAPEVLLVDEVLSVGDIAFQAKCFNRIGEMRDRGTTIVLVSHNMHHIAGFCQRAIYLQKGSLKTVGRPDAAIASYAADGMDSQLADSDDGGGTDRVHGTGRVLITGVSFLSGSEVEVDAIRSGDPVAVRVHYSSKGDVESPLLDVVIRDTAAGNMFQATNRDFGVELSLLAEQGYVEIKFDKINANNQILSFFFAFWNSDHTEKLDWKRNIKLKVLGHPASTGRMMYDCTWQDVPEP